MYKNGKPFFKFTVPSIPLLPVEVDLWKRLAETKPDISSILEELKNLPYYSLSPRSQYLLNLPTAKAEEFINRYMGSVPMKSSPIVCMTTLNRTAPEKNAIACPVLGTEAGDIYILDPQTFVILHQARTCNVKATPFILLSSGLFDVEFRVVIASRERNVCILRRGWLEGKHLFQTTSEIVDMILIPGDNFIVVATMDKTMHCYTKRVKK